MDGWNDDCRPSGGTIIIRSGSERGFFILLLGALGLARIKIE
jgi:hypothetical protein